MHAKEKLKFGADIHVSYVIVSKLHIVLEAFRLMIALGRKTTRRQITKGYNSKQQLFLDSSFPCTAPQPATASHSQPKQKGPK
jgi:hypothetical protein